MKAYSLFNKQFNQFNLPFYQESDQAAKYMVVRTIRSGEAPDSLLDELPWLQLFCVGEFDQLHGKFSGKTYCVCDNLLVYKKGEVKGEEKS